MGSTRKAFITGITGQDGSYLAELLLEQRTNDSRSVPLSYSKRGFPISKGRTPFTDGDVAQIDLETELSR